MRKRTKLVTFNNVAFYEMLNSRRKLARCSWRKVGTETGVSPSTFSRLSKGESAEVDAVLSLAMWAGIDINDFASMSDNFNKPEENK